MIPVTAHRAGGVLLILMACCMHSPAVADDGSADDPYRIPLVTAGIKADGVLDEEVWSRALALPLAYETSPGENAQSHVATELLLATDPGHLYAAFRCYDPDPSEICATISDRDHMFDDDRVSLILDTFNDHRRAYMFFANPFGIQGDALDSYGRGAGDPTWDGIWDSGGRITDDGYVVEMAIPFSTLRFQRSDGEQTWGIGVGRKYSRDFDYRFALMPRDRDNTCYLCQVAKFVGFSGATPGRNIELDPTLAAHYSEARERFPDGDFVESESELEPGLTARWGITPNVVLSAAANPDFSQVEADAIQLDVNERDAIYYDEKRPFFLEGTEFFQTRLDVLHTRMLADPAWGVKVTGKEGANALGALVAHDDLTSVVVPSSGSSYMADLGIETTCSVARYRRDVGSSSTLGLIWSDRRGDGYSNTVGGVDGGFDVADSDRLEFQALTTRTEYPDGFADDHGQWSGEIGGTAHDVEYNHDSATFDWWLAYREVEQGFRADLGRRPRSGFRQARTGWSHTWRAEAGHWYTSFNTGFGYVYNEECEGRPLDRFLDGWLNYSGPSRSFLNLYGVVGTESYRGVDYDDRHLYFDSGYWPTGSLFVRLEGVIGDEVDGDNERAGSQLWLAPMMQCKLGPRLDLLLRQEWERLDVEEGRLYTKNRGYLRASYQFTRRMLLRAILQYAEYDLNEGVYTFDVAPRFRHAAAQLLFSYKINPQTVLYLGYSDNHFGDETIRLTQNDRTFFAKIGYALVL